MTRKYLPKIGDELLGLRVVEYLPGNKVMYRDYLISRLEVRHARNSLAEIVEYVFQKLEAELRKDLDAAAEVQNPQSNDASDDLPRPLA